MEKQTLSIDAGARNELVALLSTLTLTPAQGANVQRAVEFLAQLKAPEAPAEKTEEK